MLNVNGDLDNRNKVAEGFKVTTHRVYLNFKAMGNDMFTMSLIFLLPTIIALSSVVIAPIKYNLGNIIAMSIMIVEIVTYGTVAGAFRRSTLNKNSNLTIGVRWIDNLATLITMIFVSMITLLYVLTIVTLFDVMGILIINSHWLKSRDLEYLVISAVNLWSYIYWSLLLGVITYSISYFFQGFFDSDMMFVTLGIFLFIGILIFGATLNSYFTIDNVYDPKGEEALATIKYIWTPMGDSMFIPSLFFPYYAPSQFMRINSELITNLTYDRSLLWTFFNSSNSKYFNESIWKWNILWFVPYMHIFFWWFVGFIYKDIIR